MRKETSQWSKDVRKAVIDKDMTLKQLCGGFLSYQWTVFQRKLPGNR